MYWFNCNVQIIHYRLIVKKLWKHKNMFLLDFFFIISLYYRTYITSESLLSEPYAFLLLASYSGKHHFTSDHFIIIPSFHNYSELHWLVLILISNISWESIFYNQYINSLCLEVLSKLCKSWLLDLKFENLRQLSKS